MIFKSPCTMHMIHISSTHMHSNTCLKQIRLSSYSVYSDFHMHIFLFPFAHYNKKWNHEVGKNYHENATRHFLLPGALIVSPINYREYLHNISCDW